MVAVTFFRARLKCDPYDCRPLDVLQHHAVEFGVGGDPVDDPFQFLDQPIAEARSQGLEESHAANNSSAQLEASDRLREDHPLPATRPRSGAFRAGGP